jgi:AraC family transcriptional regulator
VRKPCPVLELDLGQTEVISPNSYSFADARGFFTVSAGVADLTQLIASFLAEKYTDPASEKPDLRGGLPIRQLRKVEDRVREHLAEDISLEALAQLVDLSPFHFSRVFKHATGMSPLQFVTRERITYAQQLIRETARSIIDIGMKEDRPA